MLRIEIRHHTMASTIDRDINADVEGVERAVVYRADLTQHDHRRGSCVGPRVTGGLLGFPSRERDVEGLRVPCPAQATEAFHCASSLLGSMLQRDARSQASFVKGQNQSTHKT